MKQIKNVVLSGFLSEQKRFMFALLKMENPLMGWKLTIPRIHIECLECDTEYR